MQAAFSASRLIAGVQLHVPKRNHKIATWFCGRRCVQHRPFGLPSLHTSPASKLYGDLDLMKTESDPKNDLWAFREGRKSVPTAALFRELAAATDDLCARSGDTGLAMAALLRAGEFESALADANDAAQTAAQQLTDAVANVFLGDTAGLDAARRALNTITRFELPETVSISPPEGFAYYALHPHDFARLAERAATETGSALVIGIRSIGTTLSAVVRAALAQRGKATARTTVRPTGHPYDRVVQLTPEQLQSIRQWNGCEAQASQKQPDTSQPGEMGYTGPADFLVVDEGPGRSGSSFLSVAEALVCAGVATKRISLLGSRAVEVDQLCAENARTRWSQFRFLWPEPSVYRRFSDHTYIGGGNWRDVLLGAQGRWPVCWPQMERLKFLSPDGSSIYKFEGFGAFGEEILGRATLLAKAGFGTAAEEAGDGMIRYPMIRGQRFQVADVSTSLLQHLARYCAFRATEFRIANAPATQLPDMVGFNTLQEFGVELGSGMEALATAEPVLTDGRMQPHEWIGVERRIIKVDAYTHGDDHFFPGPTDIAWDLAGIIVEWNLDDQAADFLMSEFRRMSGLDRTQAIQPFVFAYTVFHLAYWKMALSTVTASPEEERVLKAYQRYRTRANRQLGSRNAVKEPAQPVKAYAAEAPLQPGTAA